MLDASDRNEGAIAWSRKGISEREADRGRRRDLENTLASLHRAQGQTEEPINVYWEVFVSGPSLES